MATTRFILVGGFHGAGKTTALLRLARAFADRGRRVGIITNDQGSVLVDTATFRTAGFAVEGIPDGCFCCQLEELLAAAGRLSTDGAPDILLAEPVGSCTDVVSTVIRPLSEVYGERFRVAPYVALLDPHRARQALTGAGRGAFSAKITYLFQMQQHEAEVVAINKLDLLSAPERAEITEVVRRHFPRAGVIGLSARTGEGFDDLLTRLDLAPAHRAIEGLDAAAYQLADEQLAWVSHRLALRSDHPFPADRFLLELAEVIQSRLCEFCVEPAHVKMILTAPGANAVANIVGSATPAELSRACGGQVCAAELLINARVEGRRETVEACLEATFADLAPRYDVRIQIKWKGPSAVGRKNGTAPIWPELSITRRRP